MIVFVDPYEGRGGGQAVLEELLRHISPLGPDLLVAMPEAGRRKIDIPVNVETCEVPDLEAAIGNRNAVLVSNANSSHIGVVLSSRSLRRRGNSIRSIAILHNYPRNMLRHLIVKAAVGRFDTAVAVEPGLAVLRRDAFIPSWLSASQPQRVTVMKGGTGKKVIKCFARPDPSKGLHLLPAIFTSMEQQGFECMVALGDALESNSRYVRKLKASLAPWLVEGRRGPDWLDFGDIFLVP